MIPLIPNPVDKAKQGLVNLAQDWLVDLAGKAGQSAQMTMEKAATFWVTGIKSPQLTYATDQNPYTPASTVGYLWAHLHWYVSGLAVLSIFIAAGKMAWQRNGAPGRELLQSILTLMVVSSAGVATISLMTTASDEAASYILKDAMTTPNGTPTDFQTAFGALIVVPNPTPANAFALVGLMALVWLASVVQVVLLIIRGGMLFLLAGVLPLAAAATNTEMGRQWFKKAVAWVIAFILYKPVAAIVYATAFQLTREGGPTAPTPGDQIIKVITGLTMCILAVYALPALMRFTTPAVAAAAGGGSGGGLALGGALAMGAKAAMSKVNGGGGGGGGGKSGGGGGKTGSESSSGGGPQGNSMPGGGKAPAGQTAGKSATTKAGAAAGPVGAVAAGVADGLKKVSEAANSAVSNAAGEETPGSTPNRSNGPGKGGKGPSGGPSSKGKPPVKTPPSPPGGNGPTGSQQGKSTPPTKPPTTEGPSGGKRH
jgi:hypothetical protein